MALALSRIVRVTGRVAAAGAARRDFGRTLYLAEDTGGALDASGPNKVREFRTQAELEAAIPTSAGALRRAAAVYFSQTPHPRPLLVGHRATSAEPWRITGGAAASPTDLRGISGQRLEVGGEQTAIISLSSVSANEAAIAVAIQTALVSAGLTGVTVSWASSRYVVSRATAFEPLVFSENALSTALGLTPAAGAVARRGIASGETYDAALSAIAEVTDDWYFVAAQPGIGADSRLAINTWCASRVKMFADVETDDGALVANESTTGAARLSATRAPRTFTIYNGAATSAAHLSLCGHLGVVNYDQPASLLTAKFAVLPGVTPDRLSETQANELDRKRVNHYAYYGAGDDAFVGEGTTFAAGGWIDSRIWLDWFTDAVQTELFGALRRSGRVPLTGGGIAAIREALLGVCEEGVRNGGIAPGDVSSTLAAEIAAATGDPDFGTRLSNGYLVVIGRLADQAQSAREARVAPPISIFLKGSSAIHSLDVALTFEE